MMKRVKEQLKTKDLEIELTDDAKSWLSQKGYDASLGARPLRRTIQREVEDVLSEKILLGEFRAGQLIVVDTEEDAIVFRPAPAPTHPPPVALAPAAAALPCSTGPRRARRPGAGPSCVTASSRALNAR